MILPTKKRMAASEAHAMTTTVIGVPKIGKSTFAANAPEPLFFAFEDGCRHLDVFITPEDGALEYTWPMFLTDLRDLRNMKRENKCPYDTLVIDTIDLAVEECRRYVLGENKAQHESDLAFGKGWSMVKSELARVLATVKRLGFGVILITHHDEKEVSTFDGKKHTKSTTTLSKAGREIVFGLSDVILFATVERGPDHAYRRVIKTKPGRDYDAGGRYPRGGEGMPRTLPLDYACFADAFQNGLTGAQLEERYGFVTEKDRRPKVEEKIETPQEKTPEVKATPEGSDVDPLSGDVLEKTALGKYAADLNEMPTEDVRAEWKSAAAAQQWKGEGPKTMKDARAQLIEWFETTSEANREEVQTIIDDATGGPSHSQDDEPPMPEEPPQ